jgi:alkyl sulfatase BDS1-like metallo-beta-lactamase superfamily hydrolase
VGGGLRPRTIQGLLDGMPLVFQRGKAKGLAATYHFTFTGAETRLATISIRERKLSIVEGHVGSADIAVSTDATAWLEFLYKERRLPWMLLTRKLRIKGRPSLLMAFGKCFAV